MFVYVGDEQRELHVYDRFTGKDYAKSVLCSQERLDTGNFGEFTLTEEEYKNWQHVLAVLQESEDIRYRLRDCVDDQELNEFMYEETRYLFHIRDTVAGENMSLKELQQAIRNKDREWLRKNGFVKTLEKIG